MENPVGWRGQGDERRTTTDDRRTTNDNRPTTNDDRPPTNDHTKLFGNEIWI